MPPTILLDSLHGVRRRVRTLGLVYGVGIVIATAVGLLLATVLADYFLNLPGIPRVVVMLLATAAVVYVTWRWLLRPLMARLTLSDVAGRLEQAFPQFNDRLRSTVDFVTSDIPGSEMMKQRVVGEATALATQLDLSRAVVAKPAWFSMGAGLGAIAFAILLSIYLQPYARVALSRLMSPFADNQWPKRTQIALASDTPQRVPVGQRVDVRMKLVKGDRSSARSVIFYQYDDGPVQRELMIRDKDGVYTASLDARVESGKSSARLNVWMQSGDDEMRLSPITVVPRLSIRTVEAEVTPPAYVSDGKTSTVNLMSAPALVADGSKLKLSVTFNKPLLQDAPVEIVPASSDNTAPAVQWAAESGVSASGTWLARQSLRFHIKATDTDHFTNNALEEFEIIVRPDQIPSVQIENPRRNEERTAKSLVPLMALAEDDYGIQWLKLAVERMGDKKKWEIPLIQDNAGVAGVSVSRAEGTLDRLRLRAAHQWELGQLADADLKPGDMLEYYLIGKDNFALDGQTHQEVTSGRLRINIITPEDAIGDFIDKLRQMRDQIQGVRNQQERTRQQTQELANDTRQRPQLDAGDLAAAQRLTNQQATSAAQTQQIAGRIAELLDQMAQNRLDSQELQNLARDVAGDLRQAAENPMRQATQQLSALARQSAAQQNQTQQRNPTSQPGGASNQQLEQQQAQQSQQQGDQRANANAQRSATTQPGRNGAAQRGQQGEQQANANAQQQGQQQSQPGEQGQQGDQQQRDQQANAGQNPAGQQQPGQQQNGQQQAQQRQNGDPSEQQANAAQQQNRQQQGGDQQNGEQQQDQQQANAGQQRGGQQQSGQQQNGQQRGQQQGQQQANAGQQRGGQQQSGQQQSGQQRSGQQQSGQQQNGQQQGQQQANAGQQRGGQQQSGQQQRGQQQGGQQQSGQQQSGQRQSGQQQGGQQQGQQQNGQQQANQQQQQGQQNGQQQDGQQQQSPQERQQAFADAVQRQQQANEQLDRALERMASIGSMQQQIQRLRDILNQQRDVSERTRDVGRENAGLTPEQMKQQDREQLNQVADDQQRLAEQTARTLDEMQRMAQQMQRSDPASSQAMQQAAQRGQQQQTSQNQQRASQQARQNQQGQAQAAQRQAEVGLEMILNDLNEAERHRLAQLQRQLEELQAQIDRLIQRQAGHNVDNLTLQGPERLARVDVNDLADLMSKAVRNAGDPAEAAAAPQLSQSQELTERNTRDLGKTAEQNPNGAEPAAHLTRAAGKMERAIISLRDSKLPDAYDPNQIEALAELEAARKVVSDQQSQVDQQVEEQQREGLRQRYVKIRDAQVKLNEEVTKIDGARAPDGALGRPDAVRLGQLPDEQGKLSDDVEGISEDLAAATSVVYVWANKDISQSMKDVKSDLSKQTTGVPTRSEQKRVVAQLDAMIKNLQVRPRSSRFAQEQQDQQQQQEGQQGQGGQQGQRPPRLPPEAEIRMLQDLQRAVNDSTKTIDALPKKDEPKLTALGGRQGELRGLLDQLLQNSSRGRLKLGPEPDNKNQLPEEAKAEDVENQELDQALLQGAPDQAQTEQQANLIGDRMARSKQRLALNNDPGKITQLIQERIILDFDSLIQQAQQQEAETRNAQQQRQQRQRQQQQQQRQQQRQQQLAQQQQQRQQQQQQQQGQQQGQQQNQPNDPGQNAANASRLPGARAVNTDLSQQIRETDAEWGSVSPRLREAVLDGAEDEIPPDYYKIVSEYFKSVADKGAGQ